MLLYDLTPFSVLLQKALALDGQDKTVTNCNSIQCPVAQRVPMELTVNHLTHLPYEYNISCQSDITTFISCKN